ncbi:MAG: NAD-binding protein [Eubacterium sp.]|nr:NAD-binding protein [Eubacterium sp.]
MGKAGFIGLGIMGCPMVENLIKAGVEVCVYDVIEANVRRMAEKGAAASNPAEIGRDCRVVFLSLPNGAISKDVLFGTDGIAQYLQKGAIVVDTSSITPVEAQECADRLAERGVHHLDAPVSGGEPGAVDGTLAFMVGGDEKAFDAVMPYFEILGSSAILVGGTGSGCVTKLANQVIVNLNIAAVGEAMVLACKCGADPNKVYEAIRGGLAGSAVLDAKAPMMIARNFNPGGTIKINAKDIKNVLDTSHAVNVPMPFSAQLYELQQTLIAHGHLMDDHGGYVQYFEDLAGVTVQ